MERNTDTALKRIHEAEEKQSGHLDLSNLQLNRLPEPLFGLTSVTNLNLNGNHLEVLTEEISRLQGLKVLYLNRNRIQNIAALCQLSDLVVLQLEHNQIKTIPESIANLIRLKRLFLNHNQIVGFPHQKSSFQDFE